MKKFKELLQEIEKNFPSDADKIGVGFATSSASYGGNDDGNDDGKDNDEDDLDTVPFACSTKSYYKNCTNESTEPEIVHYGEQKKPIRDPRHPHDDTVDLNTIGLTHKYGDATSEPHLTTPQAHDAKILHDNTNVNHPSYGFVTSEYTLDSEGLNKSLLRDHLRGTNNAEQVHGKMIKHLDAAIEHHKMPKDVTVYSGLHFHPGDHGNAPVHLPAYTSTSLSPEIASHFGKADRSVGENGQTIVKKHMMRLTVPKGHPHLFTENNTQLPGEMEVILPRNTKLKFANKPSHIIKKDKYGSEFHYHIWDAEIHK